MSTNELVNICLLTLWLALAIFMFVEMKRQYWTVEHTRKWRWWRRNIWRMWRPSFWHAGAPNHLKGLGEPVALEYSQWERRPGGEYEQDYGAWSEQFEEGQSRWRDLIYLLLFVPLLLCGCDKRTPTYPGTSTNPSNWTNGVEAELVSNDNIALQIVHVGGHRLAVFYSGEHVSICEVTDASLIKGEVHIGTATNLSKPTIHDLPTNYLLLEEKK